MRNQRGITLIALVITIIVLLILAGVSIAMLTGDNGILSNAQRSSRETAIANTKEKISTAVNEAMTNYYANVYVDNGSDGMFDKVATAIYGCTGEDGVTIEFSPASKPSPAEQVTVTLKYNNTETVATGTLSDKGSFKWN